MTEVLSPITTDPKWRAALAPSVLALGAALVILGPFLPWANLDYPKFDIHRSMSALDLSGGRGWILVACGIGALFVGLLPNVAVRYGIALVAGAFAAGITYTVLVDFMVGDEVSVGVGLWVSALGAGIVIVGGFAGLLGFGRKA